MKLKIGQEVVISQDFEIEGIAGNKVTVKKGDTGFVDSRGLIHYTTGDAYGKIQKMADAEVSGYDTSNIAAMVFQRIRQEFDLDEHLDGYSIMPQDVVDAIHDVLSDIF